MEDYWKTPTRETLFKLTSLSGNDQDILNKLLYFSKDNDRETYGRILLCLERYEKEYENIFYYGTHEDGGYYSPPECFVEFGIFYDRIRPILEIFSVKK